ncbi:MAG: Rrf2 family transcriptional regulator [Longimicrobiales bacterium]|nr:Rrf2 family transcriptional regulator [Longimicrobiales bacterium]
MRLSRFTDIGLRALMYAGARGRRVSSGEIAEAFGISQDHVIKSLQALVGLGAMDSKPGRNGGYALDTDPGRLRLGEVVRKLEPSLQMAECFGPESRCPLTQSCELSTALGRAQSAFFDALDEYTVADLIEGTRDPLVQLVPA